MTLMLAVVCPAIRDDRDSCWLALCIRTHPKVYALWQSVTETMPEPSADRSERNGCRHVRAAEKSYALVSTGSAPDDNDDAIVWPDRREMQKVIPVAGQGYATSFMDWPKNCFVGRIARKSLTQQHHIVAEASDRRRHASGGISAGQRTGFAGRTRRDLGSNLKRGRALSESSLEIVM